ncbi:MAG: PadR family transcriptional regulator [Acidimicrobiia bacterium]
MPTLLDLAILGLLREGPRHGYELKRRLAEYGFWRVSFGSLYPALRRLEKAGYISAEPGEGRRKAYRPTPEGKAHFQEVLEDESTDAEEERAFRIRLAFFRYMEPDSRIGVLERRRAVLLQRMEKARVSLRRAAERTKERVDRYTLALMEHGVRETEADIAWLDELIESERKVELRRRSKEAASAVPEAS